MVIRLPLAWGESSHLQFIQAAITLISISLVIWNKTMTWLVQLMPNNTGQCHYTVHKQLPANKRHRSNSISTCFCLILYSSACLENWSCRCCRDRSNPSIQARTLVASEEHQRSDRTMHLEKRVNLDNPTIYEIDDRVRLLSTTLNSMPIYKIFLYLFFYLHFVIFCICLL